MKEQNFEKRLLSAMRKTLIAVAKDTMTKPGLRHPLSKQTQAMISDCLDIISSRQLEIEKESNSHTPMKPIFSDEQSVQSITVDAIIKKKP